MTSPSPEWIFDPVPPSGALSGGDPASYVFKPDLDTLVREVIQNSADQRAGDAPVSVTFTLEEFAADAQAAFLQGVSWPVLSEHLDAVTRSRSLINGRVKDGLDDVASGRLVVLRIDDSGTRGLTGPESGTAGNFVALCKHVLVTTDDKAARGGSHGLGKAVLWRFSSFSTVLFSSRFVEEGNEKFRLFGRTELPFHDAEGGRWAGPGWFGLPEIVDGGGRRAISVGDGPAAAIATSLSLDRPKAQGAGTSLLVFGFSEPGSDVTRPLVDVAAEMVAAASRWFWPRLLDGSLAVTVRAVSEGGETFSEAAVAEINSPFVRAATSPATSSVATIPDELAEREIVIRIPRLRDSKSSGDTEARILLRVLRVSDDGPSSEENRIALVRGAGMVVRYWSPGHLPLGGGGFRAVLLAGTRRGDEASDQQVEEFLRAAEPPSHDDWVHHTNNVRSRYRVGARTRLEELFAKVRAALVEMCEAAPAAVERGPELLARQFRIGSKGPPAGGVPKFDVAFGTPLLDREGWHIAGKVNRRRGDRAWRVDVDAKLEGESGVNVMLPISTFACSGAGVRAALHQGHLARFEVPSTTDAIEFELVAHGRHEDLDLVRRTRLRVDARPHETTV